MNTLTVIGILVLTTVTNWTGVVVQNKELGYITTNRELRTVLHSIGGNATNTESLQQGVELPFATLPPLLSTTAVWRDNNITFINSCTNIKWNDTIVWTNISWHLVQP